MPVPFVAAGGAILAGLVAAFGRLFASKLGVWIASAMAVLGLQFIATEALVEPILNQLQSMAGGIGGMAGQWFGVVNIDKYITIVLSAHAVGAAKRAILARRPA